ncbi:hypothetical protein OZX65_06645 [Leuconostocaceae bacterium ESL0723]|nr:hypothetical protein OZX65_06645 [Leuconostocaceae bacterium ESL0723]
MEKEPKQTPSTQSKIIKWTVISLLSIYAIYKTVTFIYQNFITLVVLLIALVVTPIFYIIFFRALDDAAAHEHSPEVQAKKKAAKAKAEEEWQRRVEIAKYNEDQYWAGHPSYYNDYKGGDPQDPKNLKIRGQRK